MPSVAERVRELTLARASIPLKRVVSARLVDGDRRVTLQFEAEERTPEGFPPLSIPMDQVSHLVALLVGSSGKKGNDNKPVGVISPERCKVFADQSDPGAIFLALGIGAFDLAFTLDREKALHIKQALSEALR